MSIWAKTWAYEQHPKRVEDDTVTEKKHPAAKAVLVALAEYPGPGQRQCWPSQKTLADMTDYSERQVRACLSDLEKQALIRRTERKRKDGTRRSDMIELLGPIECFGPPQDEDHQLEEPAGGQPEEPAGGQPEESSGGTRKTVPGMNRKKEPSVNTPTGEDKPSTFEVKDVQATMLQDLHERLRDRGFLEKRPLTNSYKGRLAGEIKHWLKTRNVAEVWRALDRIVDRWPERALYLTDAFNDRDSISQVHKPNEPASKLV